MSALAISVEPDARSAFAGTLTLESLVDLTDAIRSERWLDAGLAGVSTAFGTVAAVMDPLGQLIAHGLGWLMEHMEPLKGWLNDLTGDAAAVGAFAATWDEVACGADAAAEDYRRVVRCDLESMTGAGVLAYRRYAGEVAEQLTGAAGSASAVGSAIRTAATVVQVVHDLVRDAIAELVGAAISWALQIGLTVGLGTPWVVSQVATRVASLVARVGPRVAAVVTSMKALRELVEALAGSLARLGVPAPRAAAPLPSRVPVSAQLAAPTVDYFGGTWRPRSMRKFWEWDEWAEEMYDVLRADPDFAPDLVRNNPEFDPDDVRRAVRHVFEDEHLLGARHGDIRTARFQADELMAEAFHRLRSGEGTDVDRVLLTHEIAEARYMDAHPGVPYEEAHDYANLRANWSEMVKKDRG